MCSLPPDLQNDNKQCQRCIANSIYYVLIILTWQLPLIADMLNLSEGLQNEILDLFQLFILFNLPGLLTRLQTDCYQWGWVWSLHLGCRSRRVDLSVWMHLPETWSRSERIHSPRTCTNICAEPSAFQGLHNYVKYMYC